MSKLGKIVKDTIKAKKESVMGKLGDAPFEDPMEPWSAKYNAPVKNEEALTEDSVLYRYIRSKGYSPEHMDFAHRSAFARSRAFKTYKIMHQRKKDVQKGGIHDIKAVKKEEVELAEAKKANTAAARAGLAARGRKEQSAAEKDERKKSQDSDWERLMAYAAQKKKTNEEVELTEAGVGGLMNFIRSKGLDPTSMDGNHKKHYARSSEYRIFKTVQPDAEEAKSVFKEREKAKEEKKKPKKVNETSGMGERGDDWNEETAPAAKEKKPHTHEVFHNKTGQVTGRYSSLSRAHRAADKRDNEYGGYIHSVRPIKETVDEKDEVTMDIPLLIRVLEYAREDAKTDMDLHKVVENLINMRGQGCLSMDMYNKIVSIKEEIEKLDELRLSTLQRYHTKAHKSGIKIGVKAAQAFADDDMESLKKHQDKRDNRDAGIARSYRKIRSKLKAKLNKESIEGLDEGKAPNDYKDPEEADYGKTYQDMVKRVRKQEQEKKKKQPPKPIEELKKQDDNQELDSHITREEAEQLSELSKEKLQGYITKRGETIQADKAESNVARNRAADLEYRGKQAQADTNHDEADALRQRARKGATNVTKAAIKVAKKTSKEKVNEACSCETKKQSMKSARIIKSLYKKKLKESTYDWEKDDKGDGKKATAKITIKGGKTMTGKTRDTVEIEPVLKTRPSTNRP